MDLSAITRHIKSTATQLGFEHCGIAQAVRLEDDERRLEAWLSKGHHGKMSYMENHFDMRVDPTKLVPGAKSVITLLYNYFPSQTRSQDDLKISKYAYSDDYHDIIRPKLKSLLESIRQQVGDIHGRGFVDSAPVLERSWAVRSGLGWVGKNANVITKGSGSFFFLATLIVDIPLAYDAPFALDHCGTCTRCIDACPTEAILTPTVINGSQCISYLTIELKDELLPTEFAGKMDNWVFGCDICQDVCPWNRFASPHHKAELKPNRTVMEFDLQDWLDLEQEQFSILLKNSPIKRSKYKGIMRNIQFIQPNNY